MRHLGLARNRCEGSPPKLFDELAVGNISIVAMAKSKDKRSAKTEKKTSTPKKSHKSDSSFIKVDKTAFDPALASLFATSVRLSYICTEEWLLIDI
jgi:hypothetical protein